MANRVIMGQRGGVYGAWVSKPGVDVVSASAEQLMMSTDIGNVHAIASGVVSSPGGSFGISWTDLGYYPWVILGSERYRSSFTYTSTSSITVTRGATNPLVAAWNVGTPPTIPDEIRYIILNIPRP
jgi:hypothetical protein